ncbi:MAG: hypothetical protein HGB19_05210 [Chlorobiales bacterium]|jgi:hypothetical protein|nr:hypothetical protein [Chlorobiales bacterium]
MTGPKAQRIVREFWRILEVYLFFVVSVLGCTGLGKAPFSLSTKSKDRSSDPKLERRLSLKVASGEVVPPDYMKDQLVWLKDFGVGKIDISHKQFGDTFNSPLLSPREFYHSNPLLSIPLLSSPEGVAINLNQVRSPLLI